jgi:dipeptidyl aminopeptidase/acylaminoacyl peptidase
MNGDVSIPPLRDLPPARLAQRREHLLSEIAQPPSRSPLPQRGLLAVPTVVADRDDVLDRAGARSGTPTRPPSRWRAVAIAVAIVAVAALLATPALGIGDRLLSLIQGKQIRLDVQAPAWSHDGRTIVFVSWRDGNGEVYVMDADSSGPRNLTQDPAQDVRPAWSPDGRRIAFASQRDGNSEVYVMNADGSGKRNLTRDRATDDYPTWSPDGRRIAFLRVLRGVQPDHNTLYVVNADGSGLRRLPLNPVGSNRYLYPLQYPLVWSPDGRTIHSGRYLVSTDGSGSRWLPFIPLRAVWSPDGRRIAFASRPDRCLTGPPPCYSSESDIYVMNADGSGKRKLTHNRRINAEPAWSPDGRKIAFASTQNRNRDIYVMNADGSGRRNLTRDPAWDSRPSWSPDGRKITFVSNRDGRLEAHVMNADGSGQRSLTVQER